MNAADLRTLTRLQLLRKLQAIVNAALYYPDQSMTSVSLCHEAQPESPLMALGDFLILPRFSSDPVSRPQETPAPQANALNCSPGTELGIERCPHCGHVLAPESAPPLESSPADTSSCKTEPWAWQQTIVRCSP